MVSIYLNTRLDSEYLEYLGERYSHPFNYEAFDWCRLENAETGMKLPSRRELDATADYLHFFLADFRGSLDLDELGRVTQLETSLNRWRGNAHLLYSRAMEFITSAVTLYYEIPKYIRGNGSSDEKCIYLKMLFQDLEGILLELLESGESKELLESLLKTMDFALLTFDGLKDHMENSAAEDFNGLQGIRDAFEIEALLSSRL